MKSIGLTIVFFASLLFILPALTAQNGKKDADKAEKKDPDKKDETKDSEKKDEKKAPDKKEKAEKKAVEKLVYGTKFITKVVGVKADSARELSIEMKQVDPKKVYDNNVWAAQRQQQLAQQAATASTQKDPKQRYQSMLNYQRDVNNFQIDLAKRQQNVYITKSMDVQAAETAKVRAMVPPLEFDDTGNEKKYTKKELEAMKDKTGLPGYPVEFDAIKGGQYVEIYMAKVAAKKTPAKKKGPDDDDPPPETKSTRPEFVLIVILPGGPK